MAEHVGMHVTVVFFLDGMTGRKMTRWHVQRA
jgi:hypothetical protein